MPPLQYAAAHSPATLTVLPSATPAHTLIVVGTHVGQQVAGDDTAVEPDGHGVQRAATFWHENAPPLPLHKQLEPHASVFTSVSAGTNLPAVVCVYIYICVRRARARVRDNLRKTKKICSNAPPPPPRRRLRMPHTPVFMHTAVQPPQ